MSFHEHNEQGLCAKIVDRLLLGENVALVSDAGTPLISDPGYGLVSAAHDAGVKVVPLPGPSAVITALSAGGLPTDQFFFAGFLPSKSMQRRKSLQGLHDQVGTLIFYESSHRILDSLADCVDVLGDRAAVLARELTKMYETIRSGRLKELVSFVAADANQQKGEFVLLIEGAEKQSNDPQQQEIDRLLLLMMEELPLKQSAQLVAKILDLKKNSVYQRALELK